MPGVKKAKTFIISHIPKRIQNIKNIELIIRTFSKLKDEWNDDEIIEIKCCSVYIFTIKEYKSWR